MKQFVALAAKDEKVNFLRGGKYKLEDKGVAALEQKLVDFISTNTGGPQVYKGGDMKTAHKGMGITESDWTLAVNHLVATLDKFKVPEREKGEVLAAVGPLKLQIVEK